MKISVCIATYNGESYIQEQLHSILKQLKPHDEVIISDDHSTDDTIDKIKSIADKRIRIYANNSKGVISNFENALLKCGGNYIFLADQDDIWMDDKVAECVNELNNGYDLVLTDCIVFENKGNRVIHSSFFEANNSKSGLIRNLINNSYMGCCMAFNSKVKSMVMPFPKKIPMHDWWIGIVAESKYKVKFIKKPMLKYRVHNKNASTSANGISKYSLFSKIKFRVSLLYYLIQRC